MVNAFEKNTTITSHSTITVEGSPVIVAFMSATIPVNGSISISHVIQNKELFDAHAEEVVNDFKEFDAYAYAQ